MEPSTAYALVAGGCFGLLSLVQFVIRLFDLLYTLFQDLKRYIIYPFLIRRHHLIGPLTRARFCLLVIFIIINAFFCAFKVSSLTEVGVRTGDMALINLIPLFFGLHQSFVADLLGLRLQFFRFLHRSAALMCIAQATVHSIAEIRSRWAFSFRGQVQLYGLIVGHHQWQKPMANGA